MICSPGRSLKVLEAETTTLARLNLGELLHGEVQLADDAVVFFAGGSWVNGADWPVADSACFLDAVNSAPFAPEDGKQAAPLTGRAKGETGWRNV